MNRICTISFILLGLASLMGCSGPVSVHGDVPTQTPMSQVANTDTLVPTFLPTEVDTLTPTPTIPETPTLASTAASQSTETPVPFLTPQPYPIPDWTPYADVPFTVVFWRDGYLWLSEVGGQGERLIATVGWFGLVSPDGQFVLYQTWDKQNETMTVMMADIRGQHTRALGSVSLPDQILAREDGSTMLTWWDDTHVAYYTCVYFDQPKDIAGPFRQLKDIVVVDIETGKSTTEAVSTFRYPSPSGRYVLSGHNLRGVEQEYLPYRLYDRETGEEWAVTDESIPARFLGWSPDSRLMLFSLLLVEKREAEPLLVVDVETRTRRVITPEDKVAGGAVWSPDAQTIAYYQCNSPRDACVNPELWLTSPDGANRRRISKEEFILPGYEPISWTPDGSRLVIELWDVTPSIWSVRVDGTDLRPIAEGQNPQVLPAP